MSPQLKSWFGPVALVVAAVLIVSSSLDVVSLLIGGALVVVALVISPLWFPRSISDADAQDAVEAGGLAIYWRPGCSFCIRMRRALGRRSREAVWVNIYRDADAAARVRSVNDGNETVPTVFVSGDARTNPDPAWVGERLAAAGP